MATNLMMTSVGDAGAAPVVPMTVVQAVYQAAGLNTATLTFTNITATTGNLYVVVAYYFNQVASVSSVTDSGSNSYVAVTNAKSGGTNVYQTDIWYSKNGTGFSAGNVVLHMSTSILRLRMVFLEISGASTTAPSDSGNNIQTNGPMVSPTLTPTVANEILIAITASNETPGMTGVDSPFILDQPPANVGEGFAVAHYINPPLSSQQMSIQPTTSFNFGGSIASFLHA